MSTFSIIIPHHNSARLLSKLLRSIPWPLAPEVIVVDDASSEEERREVKRLQSEYAFIYNEIERHTAGAARNVGLQLAHGEWLLFADADDYFLPAAQSLLVKHQNDSVDVVYFGVTSTYLLSGQPAYRAKQVERLIARCRSEQSLQALRALHTNPWGKMIRRSLVVEQQIVFEEIPSANDAMFSVRVGVEASSVALDEEPLYCVVVNDSSMTSNVDQVRFDSNGQARLRVNAYLRQHQLGAYQLSVLGYLLGSWNYGWRYGWQVWKRCCADGNNPWVGFCRVFLPTNFYHSLKSRPK